MILSFLFIPRYNEIHWEDDVIVVLRDVRISPPYRPENCQGSQPACDRIKKQVRELGVRRLITHNHTLEWLLHMLVQAW